MTVNWVTASLWKKAIWSLVFLAIAVGCQADRNLNERQEITIFAAASLTDIFTVATNAFENYEPSVRIGLNFAGTALLRIQIEQGASADVFASADGNQMLLAQEAGLLGNIPSVFATNELVLIAKEDGPVRDMRDLAKPGIRLVVAHPEVPAGAYTERFLATLMASPEDNTEFISTIRENIVSLEGSVRLVVSKVLLGEADAGFVYLTDFQNQKGIYLVDIPEGSKIRTEYWIALTQNASNPSLGDKFIQFLKSEEGLLIMESRGFGRMIE